MLPLDCARRLLVAHAGGLSGYCPERAPEPSDEARRLAGLRYYRGMAYYLGDEVDPVAWEFGRCEAPCPVRVRLIETLRRRAARLEDSVPCTS